MRWRAFFKVSSRSLIGFAFYRQLGFIRHDARKHDATASALNDPPRHLVRCFGFFARRERKKGVSRGLFRHNALMTDPRLVAPSAARNRDLILDRLRTILPQEGLVLEVASGSGEHVVHFAAHLPRLRFQPSDPDPVARESIAAWIAEFSAANVLAPLALDAASPSWPIAKAEAIVCVNMIHISQWASTEGLFKGARKILPAGAPLYLYGAYKRQGVVTAPSNLAFDESLRERNPAWGLRNLEDVAACAAKNGFGPPQIVEMPANNLSVIFRRLVQG